MGNPLVRFCEGLGNDRRYGRNIVAPPGNQAETEKTNLGLQPRKVPSLLDNPTGSRAFTPLLQKSEAFSLRDSKGEAVVGYCDPLILRRLGASGFPEG
jgi:hypothetical protein